MTFDRMVIWFNRLVLAAAAFVMTMIALRNLRDPIGATEPLGIALRSASAVTIARVGFGGVPLGFAAALIGCVVSTRRLDCGRLLASRKRRCRGTSIPVADVAARLGPAGRGVTPQAAIAPSALSATPLPEIAMGVC